MWQRRAGDLFHRGCGRREQRARAVALTGELRRAGISVELDLAGRSIKGQLKQADRINAARTLVLEEDGTARLRDMATGEQQDVEPSRVLELLAPEN